MRALEQGKRSGERRRALPWGVHLFPMNTTLLIPFLVLVAVFAVWARLEAAELSERALKRVRVRRDEPGVRDRE